MIELFTTSLQVELMKESLKKGRAPMEKVKAPMEKLKEKELLKNLASQMEAITMLISVLPLTSMSARRTLTSDFLDPSVNTFIFTVNRSNTSNLSSINS